MTIGKREIERGAPSEEGLPYSSYVRAGDFVFLSGIIGFDENFQLVPGGIVAETEQSLSVAQHILQSAGCELQDVVKVNICLLDLDDFDKFNQVYTRFFSVNAPARATISGPVLDGACVEIELTAYKPLLR